MTQINKRQLGYLGDDNHKVLPTKEEVDELVKDMVVIEKTADIVIEDFEGIENGK